MANCMEVTPAAKIFTPGQPLGPVGREIRPPNEYLDVLLLQILLREFFRNRKTNPTAPSGPELRADGIFTADTHYWLLCARIELAEYYPDVAVTGWVEPGDPTIQRLNEWCFENCPSRFLRLSDCDDVPGALRRKLV